MSTFKVHKEDIEKLKERFDYFARNDEYYKHTPQEVFIENGIKLLEFGVPVQDVIEVLGELYMATIRALNDENNLEQDNLTIKFPNKDERDNFIGWLSDGGGEQMFMDGRTYINEFDYELTEGSGHYNPREHAPIIEAKIDNSDDELSYNCVALIYELESRLRMQFCGKGFLDEEHSRFNVPNIGIPCEDKFIVASSAPYIKYPKLNGEPLHKIVNYLYNTKELLAWDAQYIIRGYYGDEFYNKNYMDIK